MVAHTDDYRRHAQPMRGSSLHRQHRSELTAWLLLAWKQARAIAVALKQLAASMVVLACAVAIDVALNYDAQLCIRAAVYTRWPLLKRLTIMQLGMCDGYRRRPLLGRHVKIAYELKLSWYI